MHTYEKGYSEDGFFYRNDSNLKGVPENFKVRKYKVIKETI